MTISSNALCMQHNWVAAIFHMWLKSLNEFSTWKEEFSLHQQQLPTNLWKKTANHQKFKKGNIQIIQASNVCSNNFKLRLEPRQSVAFKHIRHPTTPNLHNKNTSENVTNTKKRAVCYVKRRPITEYITEIMIKNNCKGPLPIAPEIIWVFQTRP